MGGGGVPGAVSVSVPHTPPCRKRPGNGRFLPPVVASPCVWNVLFNRVVSRSRCRRLRVMAPDLWHRVRGAATSALPGSVGTRCHRDPAPCPGSGYSPWPSLRLRSRSRAAAGGGGAPGPAPVTPAPTIPALPSPSPRACVHRIPSHPATCIQRIPLPPALTSSTGIPVPGRGCGAIPGRAAAPSPPIRVPPARESPVAAAGGLRRVRA